MYDYTKIDTMQHLIKKQQQQSSLHLNEDYFWTQQIVSIGGKDGKWFSKTYFFLSPTWLV